MKRILAITVLMTAASLALADGPIVPAWIDPDIAPALPRKNFAAEATLSADGRLVTLTGEIGNCEPDEKTSEVQATIVQSSSFSSATGVTRDACPKDEPVSFSVTATAPPSKPPFQEGPAQVCGLGISRAGRNIVDIELWCTFVTLVKR